MSTTSDGILWDGDAARAARWRPHAADGSRATLESDRTTPGGALRFEFDLHGPGAWAIARCEVALTLPAHYVVSARVRGEGPPVEVQVKLVDASGASVWWWRRRDLRLSPTRPQGLTLRRASLTHAWGPASGDPRDLGAVEVAVAADDDAHGVLWLEDLRIEPRELVPGTPQPDAVRASSSAPGHEAAHVLDGNRATTWYPQEGDARPSLELDLGCVREWGGLVVDLVGDAPAAPRLLASEDGRRWALLEDLPRARERSRWLARGEHESRYIRVELDAGNVGVARLAVVPIELAASPARFASATARAAPRGRFPRHLLDEGIVWAVAGGDGDTRKALLSEDGALEVDAEAFTIEPFLRLGNRLVTWADVERHAALVDDRLPLPSVEWRADDIRLRITAFVVGPPGASTLVARYEVERGGAADADARLLLAVRPFQVTPVWQGLNLTGGVAPIERIARHGARLRVDGARDVVAVTAPDACAIATSADGLQAIFDPAFVGSGDAVDPLGLAQAGLTFPLGPAPGARTAVTVAVPLFAESPRPPEGLGVADADAWCSAREAETAAHWEARLAGVPIVLPPCAAAIAASLHASIAWILVNREGPRIQPGPRAYRRSWIRDGALTSTALAEMGFAAEAQAFFRWYAPHQLPDGRVPCAVDRRGVDHAIEHDSHGELIWGIVETFRLTRDGAFLRALWPNVLAAVGAIARLRGQRTAAGDRELCRHGLLPESISHEGYAASPVHAYWDDLFAVRALADAADAALVLADRASATRIAALRDAMRHDLRQSIACVLERRQLAFIPGSVELGDFDPTSTAIAFDPCREAGRLPRAALEQTFVRYWEEHAARRATPADAYTPYEMRNVVALLRLGWKERALGLLAWLVGDQRPVGWRQWPEVARHDRRAPGFLGDLPHGWVASTFLRAVRRLLVDENDEGTTLILGAGVPEAWVRDPHGVRVVGLPTRHGTIDFTLGAARDTVRFGFGARPAPPGGFVVVSPLALPIREIALDGRAGAAGDARRVALRELPQELVLRY